MTHQLTQKLAYQARTATGWNEPLLEALGIELPLAVGWLGRALGHNVTDRQYRAFRRLLHAPRVPRYRKRKEKL